MDSSDLGSLLTLDALLQEVSVSGAARRLGLSTPAVSHALARYRERFNDELLVRAGRRMVLTPRAQQLAPQVHQAVAQAARVFDSPPELDLTTHRASFTLSVTDYVMVIFGERFAHQVHTQAPYLDLRFISNAVDDPQRLRSSQTDLAIGIYGQLPPELKARQLISDRLVCVVRADHPELKEDTLSLDQFTALEHIQISPRGRPGGYLDDLLQLQGLNRRILYTVPYFQTALSLAARCDAILTVSERIAKVLGPELGLKLLEPPLPLEPYALSMVWHPRFDDDLAHRWLREQLILSIDGLDANRHKAPRRQLDPSDPTTGQGRRRVRASKVKPAKE